MNPIHHSYCQGHINLKGVHHMNAPHIIVTAHMLSMDIIVIELDVEELVAQPLNDAGV